jgi:hypothetical protein
VGNLGHVRVGVKGDISYLDITTEPCSSNMVFLTEIKSDQSP